MLTHLALARLNDSFFRRRQVHVTLVNRIADFFPCASGFKVVLLLNVCDGQGRRFHSLVVKSVDDGFGLGILDLERVGPLAIGFVDGLLLFALWVQDGGEAVLLSRDPALAAVIDARGVSGRRLDVSAAVELDVG